VRVEDLPVGEKILWVTGEDQGRAVPCGRDHDQGVYGIRLLLWGEMGLAEHSPGALEVGSLVDAITGKAADDASF
jgi:hypothetical protein